MASTAMTVMVTGASGHVGNNLVRALLSQGRHVRCLVREDARGIEGLHVEQVKGDVLRPESLVAAFSGIETVFHLAGRISVVSGDEQLVHEVNVEGTRNVVEACVKCGVGRMIHFSSIHALRQDPLDVPLSESRPLVEGTDFLPYDRSKAQGEKEIITGLDRGLDVIVLKPTAILGPYDFKPSYMGDVLLRLCRGQLPALVEGGYDWVDVRDVALGAIAAENRGKPGERYILSNEWVALKDLASMWGEIAGVKIPRFVCPLWLARVGAVFSTPLAQLTHSRPLFSSGSIGAIRGGNTQVSHAKATAELGYQPRPIRRTLEDTYRWLQETDRVQPR